MIAFYSPTAWRITNLVTVTTDATAPTYMSADILTIPIATSVSNWDWGKILKTGGPAWERWFDVWRLPVRPVIPNKCAIQQGMRRAASRHCIKDARRWKRRRFIQRLQRVVVYTGAVK